MYPYGYYPEYLPVQPETYVPYEYSYIDQQDVYDVYDIAIVNGLKYKI